MTKYKISSILNKLINQLRGDILNEIELEKTLIQMKDTMKLVKQFLSKDLNSYDISTTHLIFLIHLLQSENGLSMAELTNECLCDKAYTTRMIKELEKKAFVYRNKKYEGERNYKICLSESGKKISSEAFDVFKRNRNEVISMFSEEEYKQILNTFEIIIHVINRENMRKGN